MEYEKCWEKESELSARVRVGCVAICSTSLTND